MSDIIKNETSRFVYEMSANLNLPVEVDCSQKQNTPETHDYICPVTDTATFPNPKESAHESKSESNVNNSVFINVYNQKPADLNNDGVVHPIFSCMTCDELGRIIVFICEAGIESIFVYPSEKK